MTDNASGGFTDVEFAAIKERAAELRAEKGGKKAAAALEDLLKSIEAMPEDQRVIAERIHVIVSEVAPDLRPKTWYGQPAWTNAEGKVVVFFHSAAKYGTRYNSLGFEEASHLDDGVMWPTSYAITGPLDVAEEKLIAQLVRKASGSANSAPGV
ncbi:iron chaperone [Pseudactinotalea sp. Z1739]|uniref:iron chaperone n=1 Tax=Pseudactinotalea sp. Z1739 TaxID=3413028 RepID=UPI003C7B7462